MTKALHQQKPTTRNTIKSSDQSITLFLDDQQRLLIKPASAQHPYPLDAVTVLALANLLHINYQEIATEARKHNGIQKPGFKSQWDGYS